MREAAIPEKSHCLPQKNSSCWHDHHILDFPNQAAVHLVELQSIFEYHPIVALGKLAQLSQISEAETSDSICYP
jgi:hypothetical protein